jgi:hypothetical protein
MTSNHDQSGAPSLLSSGMVERYDPQDIRSAYAQCQPTTQRPLSFTWTWHESRGLDPIDALLAALNPPGNDRG